MKLKTFIVIFIVAMLMTNLLTNAAFAGELEIGAMHKAVVQLCVTH